jgi:4-amino-4-deoxy-L-arabinose transferase-like glycosyltransferase
MKISKTRINESIFYLSIFCLYVILRLWALNNVVLLEDHDSISYLKHIKSIRNFGLQSVISWSPTTLPLYPIWGSIFALSGWTIETAARLGSFASSIVLFISIVGIGRIITDKISIYSGLLILSLSEVLISLSISVLTEPTYIALVTLGIWLFLIQYDYPRIKFAIILGIVFGLSFLARMEGIQFFILIPIIQAMHFVSNKRKQYDFKQLFKWTMAFIFIYFIIVMPQILNVSYKMGYLAINGRQTWFKILNAPDGKTYAEKIYGLDYSSDQINLHYIMDHPEVLKKFDKNNKIEFLSKFTKTVTVNLKSLFEKQLGILLGPIGIMLFGFGLLRLIKENKGYQTIILLAFIISGLSGPLVHNVIIRHIVVIAPIIILLEGIGAIYVYRLLRDIIQNNLIVKAIVITFFITHLVIISLVPLSFRYYKPERYNLEYNVDDLQKLVNILKNEAKQFNEPLIIVTRKSYLAYYADFKKLPLPYTTYENLIKYCQLNNADYLYLKYKLLKNFPFMERFEKN